MNQERKNFPVAQKFSDRLPRLPSFVDTASPSDVVKKNILKHIRGEDLIQYHQLMRRALGINVFLRKIENDIDLESSINISLERVYGATQALLTTYKSYEGLGQAYSLVLRRMRGALGGILDSMDERVPDERIEEVSARLRGHLAFNDEENHLAAKFCAGIGFENRQTTTKVTNAYIGHVLAIQHDLDLDDRLVVSRGFLDTLLTFPTEDFVI